MSLGLALAGSSLIVVGFFLPWVEGANVLDLRSFTGFDLARLIRNFEIRADSGAGVNQVRATAIALYLVPALAVNAALAEVLRWRLPEVRPLARLAALAAGSYTSLVLLVVFFLSQVAVNEFELVVGAPAWGFAVVALGAGLLLWLGAFAGRGRAGP